MNAENNRGPPSRRVGARTALALNPRFPRPLGHLRPKAGPSGPDCPCVRHHLLCVRKDLKDISQLRWLNTMGFLYFNPTAWKHIRNISLNGGSKPRSWVAHYFTRIGVQVCTPPTKTAIGNYIVRASSHSHHFFPIIVVSVSFKSNMWKHLT